MQKVVIWFVHCFVFCFFVHEGNLLFTLKTTPHILHCDNIPPMPLNVCIFIDLKHLYGVLSIARPMWQHKMYLTLNSVTTALPKTHTLWYGVPRAIKRIGWNENCTANNVYLRYGQSSNQMAKICFKSVLYYIKKYFIYI